MNKFFIILVFSIFTSSASPQENVVYQTDWIGSEEMEAILVKMDENRLFPCKVEGRLDGIEIKYKGSYCPFPKGMIYFYSRWGMSDAWYDTYTEEYGELKMIEYYHTTFSDLSGSTVHQATWLLMSEEP